MTLYDYGTHTVAVWRLPLYRTGVRVYDRHSFTYLIVLSESELVGVGNRWRDYLWVFDLTCKKFQVIDGIFHVCIVFYKHKLSAFSELTVIRNGKYGFTRMMTLNWAGDNRGVVLSVVLLQVTESNACKPGCADVVISLCCKSIVHWQLCVSCSYMLANPHFDSFTRSTVNLQMLLV